MLFEHAAREELRVGHHVAHRIDFADRHVGLLQRRQRAVYGLRRAPGLDRGIDLGRARHAAIVAHKLRIVGEIVTGIVLTVVIALIIDRALVILGRVLMPWQRTLAPSTAVRRIQTMRAAA